METLYGLGVEVAAEFGGFVLTAAVVALCGVLGGRVVLSGAYLDRGAELRRVAPVSEFDESEVARGHNLALAKAESEGAWGMIFEAIALLGVAGMLLGMGLGAGRVAVGIFLQIF